MDYRFDDLLFKPLTSGHIPELTRVMTRAFDEDSQLHLGKPGGPDGYDDGSFLKKWGFNPHATPLVIYRDGRMIGAVILFIEDPEAGVLGTVFLDPDTRGQGLGRKVWDFIERTYPRSVWRLETPGFSVRNHNYYVNCLGFHVVAISEPFDLQERMFHFEKRRPPYEPPAFEPWDTPLPEWERLAARFTRSTTSSGGDALPYRLFTPDAEGARVPLVVYLHGAGERGCDNDDQLTKHIAGVRFACEEWQSEHPAFLFAPQCPNCSTWETPRVCEAVLGEIDKLVSLNKLIDPARVYIHGISMGAMGALNMIALRPRFFAGAFAVCGGAREDAIPGLVNTPIRLFHAADDPVVSVERFRRQNGVKMLGSRALYEAIKARGGREAIYTEYPPKHIAETTGFNAHCAWVPAYSDTAALNWLFERRLAQ